MNTTTDRDIQWNKRTFALLRDGAIWGVPRSGLMFKKAGDHLELHDVMPYLPEMKESFDNGADVPATANELIAYQRSDYVTIQAKFNAAGIHVTDPKCLLIPKHVTPEDLQKVIDEIAGTFPA